jgi:hypothetical protein
MSYSFLRQTSMVKIIGIIDHEKPTYAQFQRLSREGRSFTLVMPIG